MKDEMCIGINRTKKVLSFDIRINNTYKKGLSHFDSLEFIKSILG